MATDSRVEQADTFWQARRELLAESFNAFIREALPQRRLWDFQGLMRKTCSGPALMRYNPFDGPHQSQIPAHERIRD